MTDGSDPPSKEELRDVREGIAGTRSLPESDLRQDRREESQIHPPASLNRRSGPAVYEAP
jgi:hypothetical protein